MTLLRKHQPKALRIADVTSRLSHLQVVANRLGSKRTNLFWRSSTNLARKSLGPFPSMPLQSPTARRITFERMQGKRGKACVGLGNTTLDQAEKGGKAHSLIDTGHSPTPLKPKATTHAQHLQLSSDSSRALPTHLAIDASRQRPLSSTQVRPRYT